MSRWIRRWYGAGPLHLGAMAVGLAVSGYAAWRLVPLDPVGIATWVVGGALLHDLLFVPLYAGAAVILARVARGRANVANHVQVPALLSGVLLLVFAPLILRRPPAFEGITGQRTDPYLARWLALTGALFAVSLAVYAARRARAWAVANQRRP
ncbi:MAG: hypothetical protein LC744_06955 [Chloroflexi bacterium]|nr:hypothetical protein [Chloroflexota bacterium]